MNIKLLPAALALVLAPLHGHSADFKVLKACDDPRLFRTSDGADAGRVEYLVLDASGRTLVAAIVTGGVVGTRLVSVPATSMRFGKGNEVSLPEIRRERLINAPVIERASLLRSTTIRPEIVERSYTHFGAPYHGAAPAVSSGSPTPAPSRKSRSGR